MRVDIEMSVAFGLFLEPIITKHLEHKKAIFKFGFKLFICRKPSICMNYTANNNTQYAMAATEWLQRIARSLSQLPPYPSQ